MISNFSCQVHFKKHSFFSFLPLDIGYCWMDIHIYPAAPISHFTFHIFHLYIYSVYFYELHCDACKIPPAVFPLHFSRPIHSSLFIFPPTLSKPRYQRHPHIKTHLYFSFLISGCPFVSPLACASRTSPMIYILNSCFA